MANKYTTTSGSIKIRLRCTKCSAEAVHKRRKAIKLKAVAYKGGKCLSCGYSKYVEALEFHHVNPNEKDFVISKVGLSWPKVKDELDKCVLLCSNCHKELHAGNLEIITQVAQLAEHSPD